MRCEEVSEMIYWDNAATTWPKPPSVIQATTAALRRYGANPGRAGHRLSIETAAQVYECRREVAAFFGLQDETGVIFTKNCTESLNLVIRSLLEQGGRAVISDLEHNAVMRPLAALGRLPRYDVAAWSPNEEETIANFRRAIRPDTKLLLCTHASNVFGVTLPIRRLGQLAQECGLLFCVDAAQSAGVLPLDMEKDHIDYLCVAPHKGLYAPMGTGLLLCRERKKVLPMIRGGTGSFSLDLTQPKDLPERLESGTLNLPGIVGMRAGMSFVRSKGRDVIYRHEIRLLGNLYDRLKDMKHIVLYTPRPVLGQCAPVMSVNVASMSSEVIAGWLDDCGIAVRAGLHCAPCAHRRFGTLPEGTVRFAPSAFSTPAQMEKISELFANFTEKSLHVQKNML